MNETNPFTITGKNEDGILTASHANGFFKYALEPLSGKWYRVVQDGLYAQVSPSDNRRLNMAYIQWMNSKGQSE